ncbi:MAG TPA: hypothetical protein VJL28_11320 [Gemmatimonadaceae bacterium]|nr:hypothetical protein [Gemmatimonadaceae bacterium]
MAYRESAKPPSEKQIDSMAQKFAELLRSEKSNREQKKQLQARVEFLEQENDRLTKLIQRYDRAASALDAGGTIQVQLTQLRNAFAGSKEEIGDLKHARDVAIGLVRATLAGADPGEVGRLVEHIRTTGRAHGISMKALPEPEKEKER